MPPVNPHHAPTIGQPVAYHPQTPVRIAPPPVNMPSRVVRVPQTPPVRVVEHNGAQISRFNDHTVVVQRGDQTRIVQPNGRVQVQDRTGRVTREIHGAVQIDYRPHGRIETFGPRVMHEHARVNQFGVSFIERKFVFNTSIQFNFVANYYAAPVWGWNEPLWFYQPVLALGALDYSFFIGVRPFNVTWGVDYWDNLYPVGGTYCWWHHWRNRWTPYVNYERPAQALVNSWLATTFELAEQTRLEAARVRERLRYEQALLAETEEQLAQLQFATFNDLEAYRARPVEAVVEDAANLEAQQAQQEMEQAVAQQTATPISDYHQQQLVSQVEQINTDRLNQVPTNTAFEQAMADANHLYVISGQAPEIAIDAGNGQQCVLRTGDILKRFDGDQVLPGYVEVVGEVMSLQEGSCPAGRPFRLTVPQLKDIYEAGLAVVDAGAQQLANQNQPRTEL